MIAYLLLSLCYCFVYLQAYTTLPLAMRLRGLSPQEYGLAMAVNGLLIIALQPLVSGWLGKHDHCTVLAGGFVIVGLGFGLTALAGSVAGYAATVAVWTLGEIVTAGLGAAIVADLAPVSMRAATAGRTAPSGLPPTCSGRSAARACWRSVRPCCGSPVASWARGRPPDCWPWDPRSGAARGPPR